MESASNRYFELSTVIDHARADGDYERAVQAARDTYLLMPLVVEEMKRQHGSFDIFSSPAFHTAPTLMAAIGNRQAIVEFRKTLQATPELEKWLPLADQADADADLVERIMAAVSIMPGLKQKELKAKIEGDTSRLGFLTSRLENCGMLQRVSQGSTYLLYPRGFSLEQNGDTTQTENGNKNLTTVAYLGPRGRAGPAARARLLDFYRIQYVRLPKAPLAWETRPQNPAGVGADNPSDSMSKRGATPHFETCGAGWSLADVKPLAPKERPSTAYRDVLHTADSTIWIDPHGKRVGFPTAPAVVMATDRGGVPFAERGIAHGVYRSDVNGDGSGMVFLSEDGILHGYSASIEPLFAWRLAEFPEYTEQAKRFGIPQRNLKNHVRTVALSQDRTRCVVTIVDEAWCFDVATMRPIWGLRFPSKEGWTEVAAERSDRVGIDSEIRAALDYMELNLPVSPEAITHQYRELAKRWHPDRHPNDPAATVKFQRLRTAMELLTGIDLSHLSGAESERVEYRQVLHKSTVNTRSGLNVTISMSVAVGGAFGADWIYAAHFADNTNTVFLGGYSGKIVEVGSDGIPLRVYDIGTVPRQIARTGSYLSILAYTRLYVLQENQLIAFVDVQDAGNLIVGTAGFGLLQSKRFQWLTPNGEIVGAVKARDPLRRIFHGAEGLIVETRTERAHIHGAPAWWTVSND